MSTTEHDDLLDTLRKHRELFRGTVAGITDDQARQRSTVSELTLGGLIKHVAATEAEWARFVVDGPDTDAADVDWESIDWSNPPAAVVERMEQFVLGPDETLAGVLATYEEVAAATDSLIAGLDDLGAGHALPEAPWFAPDTVWSARRVAMHIVAETAQHAGHADIIREAIDGQKSMG